MIDMSLVKAYELLKLAQPDESLSEENREHWRRWRDEWVADFERECRSLTDTHEGF